jgi:outer membrane receptor protein involved in Fe transport
VAIDRHALTRGETISPYTEVTWEITKALELSGGVRYTSETKDTLFVQPYIAPLLRGVYLNGADIVANQKFTNTSPEATLTWKISPDATTYFAYKTGYKSGGYSGTSIYGLHDTPNLHEFTPETASGFELGLKGKAFDNTLRLELGLYTYDYNNLQIEFQTPEPALISLNAGKARSSGVELEGQYYPPIVRGLSLTGSVNYNDAHYVTFLAPCYTGQTPAAGCTLTGFQGTPFQDLSGRPLLDAPHWTATLGAVYERPINDRIIFAASVDVRYSDSYTASQISDPFAAQSAYNTVDLTVGLHTADRRWDVSLVAKNLTDAFYITGSNLAANTGGHTGTPAGVEADEIGWGSLPRTFELRISYRM